MKEIHYSIFSDYFRDRGSGSGRHSVDLLIRKLNEWAKDKNITIVSMEIKAYPTPGLLGANDAELTVYYYEQ